jgi:hypothetical protein
MEFGAALMSAKITGKPDIYAVGDFNDCSPWFFHPLVKRRENLEKIYKEIGEVK